eukprot:SAG31_NODE_1981_length_6745_cov_84.170178_4_plen_172_part_00
MRENNSWAGEVDFGPLSVWGSDRYNVERLAWFRRWLLPSSAVTHEEIVAAADSDKLPVQIFVMGGGSGKRTIHGRYDHGGSWRAEADWPLARASEHTFHLRTEDGKLFADRHAERVEAAASFEFDPANPVPTLGGSVIGGLMGLKPVAEGGPAPPYGNPENGDQVKYRQLW